MTQEANLEFLLDAEARQERYRDLRARAAELRERAAALSARRPLPKRERTKPVRRLDFAPYDQQRRVMRAYYRGEARTLTWVSGRQVGKSTTGIALTVAIAFARPGSYSAFLAPSHPIARSVIDKMLEVVAAIPGVEWKEQQKRLVFPNGSVWQVWSAERKGGVGRGPSITGLLWIDEAAMVHKSAWFAIRGGQAAATKPLRLLTTTPLGRNWVWDLWSKKKRGAKSFRWPSWLSPYADLEEVADARDDLSREAFDQEYGAVFVDSLIQAFSDLSGFWALKHPDRSKDPDPRITLGIDLGKDMDWTVLTIVNKYGEAEVIGRWQHVGWEQTEARVFDAIERFKVGLVVVDQSGVGSYLHDKLVAAKVETLGVKTAILGLKARLVELARADVQHGRLTMLRGQHTDQLEHELRRFQGKKRAIHGNEVMVYEGVQLKGEHDDCVISLCLANWGREHGWTKARPRRSDLGQFVPRRGSAGGYGFAGGSGYVFGRAHGAVGGPAAVQASGARESDGLSGPARLLRVLRGGRQGGSVCDPLRRAAAHGHGPDRLPWRAGDHVAAPQGGPLPRGQPDRRQGPREGNRGVALAPAA